MDISDTSADASLVHEKVLCSLVSAFENGGESCELLDAELTKLLFFGRNDSSASGDSLLEDIRKQGPRQVCQYQFKKNDIVWICRSCQSDETCVLCNDCFQDSVHQGHEVYFYHSQAGGCCDCGDAGAWKPEGFCTRHGHSHPNPISTVPDDVRTYGKCVVDAVVMKILEFCEDCARSFQFDELVVQESALYEVYVHNDDIRTVLEKAEALARVESVTIIGDLGKELQRVGHVKAGGPAPFRDMCNLAQALKGVALQASVVLTGRDLRTSAFLKCVSWLYRLAQIGDGMCRLVCSAIPIPLIHRIMATDPFLSKDAVVPLHDLFLTLMADQPFKIACSRGYALALSSVATLYGQGIGVAEHCLFGLSVQFLNRYIYVEGMIHEYNFFPTVSSSLLQLMKSAAPDFVGSQILKHRRYNPLLADLKVIFTLPETPRFFCAICTKDMLEVFTLVQYLHPQTRLIDRHVEFESRDWMYAFNLYLGLGSLFDYVVNWYEAPESVTPATEIGHTLPTVLDHMHFVLKSLFDWQIGFMDSLRWDVLPGMSPGGRQFTLFEDPTMKSFHIVLHRFFATCVREGCRYSHLEGTLAAIQKELTNAESRVNLIGLIDFPLQAVVLESQIRVDMWRRNGQIMLDQIMNYAEPPFCRIFRDLDLILMQFCAPAYGTNRLMSHIIHRFGVFHYLSNKATSPARNTEHSRLVEEMIYFLILLVTELPIPGYESPADRVKIMLRREAVHKLVTGPCTYSDMQECMGLVPESEKVKSSVLDTVIEAIAEWQEGTALEPSKLRLKEAAWAEYDPSFPHATTKTHQIAMETRPKMKYAQPIVPPPPPAHPAFAATRLSLLCDPILLSVLRDLVYSHTASFRSSQSPGYRTIRDEWALVCTTACFVKVLQLLTLVMHNAFSKEPESVSLVSCDIGELEEEIGVVGSNQRKLTLSHFMLETPNIVCLSEDGGDSIVMLPSLSQALMDLYDSLSSSGGDAHTVHWLLWIIGKVEELSPECRAVVDERMSKQLDEKRALEMKERRERARARAMAAMKKSANAFAAHIEGMSDDDDDSLEGGPGQEGPDLECIVCRSNESKDTIGFLAFSQASNFLHRKSPVIHLEDASTPPPPPVESDLHIQFCGHCMHLGCFDLYYAMVIDRSGQQNGLILDTDRGQFQCPFCKKIGNVLVPNVATEQRSSCDSELIMMSSDWITRIESDPPCESSVSSTVGDGNIRDPQATQDMEDGNAAEEGVGLSDGGHSSGSSALANAISSFFRRITSSTPPSPSGGDTSTGLRWEGAEDRMVLEDNHVAASEGDREASQAMWFRFMSNICEPVLGSYEIYNRLESYQAIPNYIEKAVSAVVCSLYTETLEKGSMHHIYAATSGHCGVNAYKYMGELVAAIRSSLHSWGVRDTLHHALVLAVQGVVTGSSVPSWTEHIQVTRSAEEVVTRDVLVGMKKSWFEKPLLAIPILHAVVLLLVTGSGDGGSSTVQSTNHQCAAGDDIRTAFHVSGTRNSEIMSMYRWLCLAYLVQTIIIENDVVDDDAHASSGADDDSRQVGRKRHVENWDIYALLESITSLLTERGLMSTHMSKTALDRLLRRAVHKWISFINTSLHFITRLHPQLFYISADAPFPDIPQDAEEMSDACIAPYAAAVGMRDITSSSIAQTTVISRVSSWLDAFATVEMIPEAKRAVMEATCWNTRMEIPSFVSIPDEYTKLHGLLNSQCSYEYPAICLCCGAILDSAGKGLCTAHLNTCGGEVGIFFLLQDCSLLLLHRRRGSYYASPYVDAHGEKHRHYRGRPLFIDKKSMYGSLATALLAERFKN